MRFVNIPAILSTVTNPGCICKRIFNEIGFSNNIFKKQLFDNAFIFFALFSLQFHEASTMVGLKIFQTLYSTNVRFVNIVWKLTFFIKN